MYVSWFIKVYHEHEFDNCAGKVYEKLYEEESGVKLPSLFTECISLTSLSNRFLCS